MKKWWKRRKRNFKVATGEVYEGEWKSDKREGKGINIWTTGEVYEGEWKSGKREGKGRNKWTNGDVYEGE